MIPHFLIIGGQKAGSTAAIRNLALHPNIVTFSGVTEYKQKEMEFFNQHWDHGIDWYSSHFASTNKVVGEKTSELLHRKICHERMCLTNPKFKLIVLLRDPRARAFSQWKMATYTKKDEIRDFDTVAKEELLSLDNTKYLENFHNCIKTNRSNWREGYLLKGMYADQLSHLFNWFPRDQVYIAIAERVRKNPVEEYNKIFQFLGCDSLTADFKDHFISPQSQPMSLDTYNYLTGFYKVPNQQLFELIGEIPEWT